MLVRYNPSLQIQTKYSSNVWYRLCVMKYYSLLLLKKIHSQKLSCRSMLHNGQGKTPLGWYTAVHFCELHIISHSSKRLNCALLLEISQINVLNNGSEHVNLTLLAYTQICIIMYKSGRAFKITIGGKTHQGINCSMPNLIKKIFLSDTIKHALFIILHVYTFKSDYLLTKAYNTAFVT